MRLIVLAWVAVVAAATGPAGAAAGPQRHRNTPLAVATTSLRQSGPDLVWTLQAAQPFTPAAFAHGRQTLCLLLERSRSGTVAAQACVAGTAAAPQLDYMTVTARGPGPAQPIAAAVSFSGGRDLTATFAPGAVGLGYTPLRWQVITTLRSPACVRAHHDRNGCVALSPRAPTLLALHVPQLVGCQATGPRLVYFGRTRRRVIALTFDDGPSPYTPQLL